MRSRTEIILRWLFFLALLGARVPVQAATHVDDFNEGLKAMKAGQGLDALTYFLAVVHKAPESQNAKESLRYIWEIGRQAQDSEKETEKFARELPEYVAEARRLLETRRQDAKKMLSNLQELAGSLPQSSSPLDILRKSPINLALIKKSELDEFSRLEVENHRTVISKALQSLSNSRSPNEADLLEVKGYLWLYQEDLELALREWQKALKMRGKDAVLSSRIEAVQTEWKRQKAKEESSHLTTLGMGAYGVSKFGEAIKNFRQALDADPSNESAAHYLKLSEAALAEVSRQERTHDLLVKAKGQYDRGDLIAAVQSWVDLLTIDPQNAEARTYLERTRKRLTTELASSREEPKTAAANTSTITPASPVAVPTGGVSEEAKELAKQKYMVGVIHLTDKNYTEAEKALKEALQWDPDSERAKNALARLQKEREFLGK